MISLDSDEGRKEFNIKHGQALPCTQASSPALTNDFLVKKSWTLTTQSMSSFEVAHDDSMISRTSPSEDAIRNMANKGPR